MNVLLEECITIITTKYVRFSMAGVFLTLFHNHQAMLNNGYHNCTRRFRVSGGLFPILVPDKQPTHVVRVYYTTSHLSLVLDSYGHE